ncbi:hypothetical protein F8M41_018592 [Gigaspora margarita]|uniref:Uncharacterized protein n=1 Tax=Gigaspora margarita TaxID=4874 RepID=A0A8H4ALC6_GIGMA|nr:hypothetical protein F8M41_018592 [Gigaspora margarita]
MSSSISMLPIKDQDQTKISIDVPHGGMKISQYVFSLNLQYIATLSKEDESIVGWIITKDLTIEYDNSIKAEDLRFMLNIDKNAHKLFRKIFGEYNDALIGISNCKQVILKIEDYLGFDFEIIDIKTKSRQILNAQGLKGKIANIAFLENGCLAIVKGEPVYRAYIFSKSISNGIHQWTCRNTIELEKFFKCFIFSNGKLMMFFKVPCVITQWNIMTRRFEMQYILNWNAYLREIKQNNDNSLLAVTCNINIGDRANVHYMFIQQNLVEWWQIVKMFDELLYNNFCFIGLREEERLFFSGPHNDLKSYNSYILNPRIHRLNKPPNTHVLRDIYFPTYQNYQSIGPINIVSDYIIKINNNYLSIQRLSQHENWKNYIESKERYVVNPLFNVKEIKQFIQITLEKYKSNQNLTQDYSNKPQEYRMGSSTWIIEYKKFIFFPKKRMMKLKACIEPDKETESKSFDLVAGASENKVLENGDMLLVFPSSIQIWTINSETTSLNLIYCWRGKSKSKTSETAHQSIIRILSSFNEKLNVNLEILPPPSFSGIKIRVKIFSLNYSLDYNELTLILYGKDLFHEAIQTNDSEKVEKLLDDCYNYSLSMIRSGNTYDFIFLISQIAFALVELEKYNKNQGFTENFLSKTNMLITDSYSSAINNSSLL